MKALTGLKQSRLYRKQRNKKINPLKGNMMDLDKKYLSLPNIFQNNVEKSPSQIDLRAILIKKEHLKSKIS